MICEHFPQGLEDCIENQEAWKRSISLCAIPGQVGYGIAREKASKCSKMGLDTTSYSPRHNLWPFSDQQHSWILQSNVSKTVHISDARILQSFAHFAVFVDNDDVHFGETRSFPRNKGFGLSRASTSRFTRVGKIKFDSIPIRRRNLGACCPGPREGNKQAVNAFSHNKYC